MQSNNFNTSSTGINIDFLIGYDEDMSRCNFDENIYRFDNSDNFPAEYLYINYGNLKYELANIWKIKPDNFRYDMLDFSDIITIDDTRQNTVLLKRFLISNSNYTYSDLNGVCVYELFEDIVSNEYIEDFSDKLLLLDNLSISYIKHYSIINVAGYSQGDARDVLILDNVLLKVWGCSKIDRVSLHDEIFNYFFDSPIIARATINDVDFISETYDGVYNNYMTATAYDRDILIKEVIANYPTLDATILHDELIDILPIELNH